MKHYKIKKSTRISASDEDTRNKCLGRFLEDMAAHLDAGTDYHDALITAIFPLGIPFSAPLRLIPAMTSCASLTTVLSDT